MKIFQHVTAWHHMAPCHTQPGRQRWHLRCALRHPLTFIRTGSVVGL